MEQSANFNLYNDELTLEHIYDLCVCVCVCVCVWYSALQHKFGERQLCRWSERGYDNKHQFF